MRVDLLVIAFFRHTNLLVLAHRRCKSTAQAFNVIAKRVVVNVQLTLHDAGVTQIAHAQRRCIFAEISVITQHGQGRVRGCQIAFVDGRRSPEQVKHQPAMTLQVTDQAEIPGTAEVLKASAGGTLLMKLVPKAIGDGEVVVDPGDRLHTLAIAMRQSLAVQRFDLRRIRVSILRDADRLITGDFRRHGRIPQILAIIRLTRCKSLQFFQKIQALCNRMHSRCDKLHLSLRKVCRDKFVR